MTANRIPNREAVGESGGDLPLPQARCLTKDQAATYLGIKVTLLTELGVPFVKLGRRCVYDRFDLDAWLDEYKAPRAGQKGDFMARESGIHRRRESRYWWFDVVLPDGRRIRQSSGTQDRAEAEAFLVKLKADAYRDSHLGIKRKRTWQEAVVRYLSVKATIRSAENYRGICRRLDTYLGRLTLDQINADVIWNLCEREQKKGRRPATINRYLAQIRALLRMAYYDWQWLDRIPRVRLLPGEVERNRWLTKDEAQRLIDACPPHLVPLVRYALATGCRAREIADLEWDRVDLARGTAWLDQTKNGTPRGVPLNSDAVAVLESVRGQHPQYCFTYRGQHIRWELTNTGWKRAVAKAGLAGLRFHDLRHTWASWHRQAGTSTDELKDLGGWKSRNMVDRYAKFGTEHLTRAAARIESGRAENVVPFPRFPHSGKQAA